MAKLHFFYSVMNAGKSAQLLLARHNYDVHGFKTLLFTSATDTRSGEGLISSRLGISAPARALVPEDDLFEIVKGLSDHSARRPKTIVFIDEIQFLTPEQIRQASDIADDLNIPVLAYGLKNNVFGDLFSPAVATALAHADAIREIKQMCHCGSKATMILRFDGEGRVDRSGDVVKIGAEESYVSVCRRCFKCGDIGNAARRTLVAEGECDGPVVCATCEKAYISTDGMFFTQQAYRCSAVVDRKGITGHYGSTVADGDRLEFVGQRPAHVRSGNMCDPCITSLMDGGLIKTRSSLFGGCDDVLRPEDFFDPDEEDDLLDNDQNSYETTGNSNV
ncbi:thymidine kinase [Agrobacterium rubi]|nr:thymidine kinase [Agrobacterium rubi]NTF24726.1 thymidine kinase [Agrobacterium rubi]